MVSAVWADYKEREREGFKFSTIAPRGKMEAFLNPTEEGRMADI